jgi:hypothetical protein
MGYHLCNCDIWIFNNGFTCSVTLPKICMLQFNNNYGHGVFLSFWKLEKCVSKLCVVLSTFMTMKKVLMNAANVT